MLFTTISEVKYPKYQLHTITCCDTIPYKFNVKTVHIFKTVYKFLSSLTSFKMLGLNITLAEEIAQKAKIFVQAVTCNGKLSQDYLPAGLHLLKILNQSHQCHFHQMQIHLLRTKTCFFTVLRLAELKIEFYG